MASKHYLSGSKLHLDLSNELYIGINGWKWRAYGTTEWITEADGSSLRQFWQHAQTPQSRHIHWKITFGSSPSKRSESLSERFFRIERTLVAQTDFGSASSVKKLEQDLITLESLQTDLIEIPAPHTSSEKALNRYFIARLEAEAKQYANLASSVLDAQGACNPSIYERLVTQLENWNLGSASYFYDLQEDAGLEFSAQTKLTAQGIRQKLRRSLKKRITPYCDAQNEQSKINFILND